MSTATKKGTEQAAAQALPATLAGDAAADKANAQLQATFRRHPDTIPLSSLLSARGPALSGGRAQTLLSSSLF
jgi:hypothetical protein